MYSSAIYSGQPYASDLSGGIPLYGVSATFAITTVSPAILLNHPNLPSVNANFTVGSFSVITGKPVLLPSIQAYFSTSTPKGANVSLVYATDALVSTVGSITPFIGRAINLPSITGNFAVNTMTRPVSSGGCMLVFFA
jgi:hypothetical protein